MAYFKAQIGRHGPTAAFGGTMRRLATAACMTLGVGMLGGCAWWSEAFDETTSAADLENSLSLDTAETDALRREAWPTTSTSGPQRGLLIETENGPVPAQFTARNLMDKPSRCAKLNNYWCIKTPTDGQRWDGQIGEDSSGHARFSDPVYSARAFARTIRSYYFRRDIKSISGIINRYAPSSDCIGSLSYCPVSGTRISAHRDINGTGRLGSQYVYYTATKPDSSQFSRGTTCNQMLMYCPKGRNQSEEYATDVARTLKVSPASNLGMFDTMGRVHYQQMVTLMHAISKWELGNQYSVEEALIREGLIMEVEDFRDSDPDKWPGIRAAAFTQNQ